MSVKPVTYYEVECDYAGCAVTLNEISEFSAFKQEGYARDHWIDALGVVLDNGETFCEAHSAGICARCGATDDLAEDPIEGGMFCPEHLPAEDVS